MEGPRPIISKLNSKTRPDTGKISTPQSGEPKGRDCFKLEGKKPIATVWAVNRWESPLRYPR
jgi:hypothetical protein